MRLYLRIIDKFLTPWLWNFHPKFDSLSILFVCTTPLLFHFINLIKYNKANISKFDRNILMVDTICRVPQSLNAITSLFFPNLTIFDFNTLFMINGVIMAYQIMQYYKYTSSYNKKILFALVALKFIELYFKLSDLTILRIIIYNISVYYLGVYKLNLIKTI